MGQEYYSFYELFSDSDFKDKRFSKSPIETTKAIADFLGAQIIKHIIKCVLMPENQWTVNYWANEISEKWIFPTSELKRKAKNFSYSWFFICHRTSNGYEEKYIKHLIRKIQVEKNTDGKLKYPGLKYKYHDIISINDTLLNLEETLELLYKKNKFKILGKDQVKQLIINCLPQNI